MRIVVENIAPPIPVRAFDWIAYDGDDEDGPKGYGRTKNEALDSLLEDAEPYIPGVGVYQKDAELYKKLVAAVDKART